MPLAMKKIFFHILMLIIGLLGIFFGTLPDLFPSAVPVFLIGYNRELEVGYKQLTKHLSVPIKERDSDIALGKNDYGYNSIYLILHKLNPKVIPPLSNLGNDRFGNLSFDHGFDFVSSGTGLLPNQVLFFEKSTDRWRAVCEMRDLFFIIRDSHIRYYARIGFFLAFISISIEGIVSICSAIRSATNK
jgi:hypothetical protein